jgi:hypothetical protein
MLMIIAVLRRHEELGSVEGMFTEQRFIVSEDDLKWGLAYIFYCMMQTSTIYDRLRRETQEEEAPKRTRMSALSFLHILPRNFTTAEAIRIGAEYGIGEGGVAKKLVRLTKDYYIAKVRHGVFVKVTKAERNRWKGGSTVLAA